MITRDSCAYRAGPTFEESGEQHRVELPLGA
jgi:hypothetical protein